MLQRQVWSNIVREGRINRSATEIFGFFRLLARQNTSMVPRREAPRTRKQLSEIAFSEWEQPLDLA